MREAFPDWSIHEVFGGFEAVPIGTPIIRAIDLNSLMEKLVAYDKEHTTED
jgi:hypothetical protein